MMLPMTRGISIVPTISGTSISKNNSKDHAWLAPESTISEWEVVMLSGLVLVTLRQDG